MDHLISSSEFFESGLPVSDDILSNEVLQAVNTIEQYILYPYLGDTLAGILGHPENYVEIFNAPYGLKQMMYHFTFAYLLIDKIRLTRYSSVIKNDNHSTDPGFSELKTTASWHWEIARSYLQRICNDLGIDWTVVSRNDTILNELIY